VSIVQLSTHTFHYLSLPFLCDVGLHIDQLKIKVYKVTQLNASKCYLQARLEATSASYLNISLRKKVVLLHSYTWHDNFIVLIPYLRNNENLLHFKFSLPYILSQLCRMGTDYALLTCILEVLGSNLGQDTCYSDRFLVVFFSPSRQMPGQYLQ
jgi:hypothetical protein